MSNVARFYWAKLEGATNKFRESKTEAELNNVQDICCQLVNEFRCPRLCQQEACIIRSQCFPDNYWFAKHQPDKALKIIAECEEKYNAGCHDLEVLAEAKKGVEVMLQERSMKYQEEWTAKDREVARSKGEWQEIVETVHLDSEKIFVPVGKPVSGSDMPFLERRAKDPVVQGKARSV